MEQVSTEHFGIPCQFSFHEIVHMYLLSDANTIGQLLTDVPTGSSHPTPPYTTKLSTIYCALLLQWRRTLLDEVNQFADQLISQDSSSRWAVEVNTCQVASAEVLRTVEYSNLGFDDVQPDRNHRHFGGHTSYICKVEELDSSMRRHTEDTGQYPSLLHNIPTNIDGVWISE
jgi:hypothetical protein